MQQMLCVLIYLVLAVCFSPAAVAQPDLPPLVREAQNPGPLYRPAPLWWWDADKLEPERLRWQLRQFHEKGVDQVCLIYLAPLWSQPPYFTEDWWSLYRRMVDEANQLGMKVWLTDGIAWGSPFINNSVLEANPEFRGQLLDREETLVRGPARVRHEIPQGYEVTEILGAFAYQSTEKGIDVEDRHDLTAAVRGRKLEWDAPAGQWRVMIFYIRPMGYQSHGELGFGRGYGIDYTNPEAMRELFRLTVGEYDRRVKDRIGSTIVGTFQDELVTHHHYGFPPYARRYAAEFQKRMGYDIRPLLGALYHDAGKLTDKIRCAYFEVLLQLFEEAFYKPYYQWHEDRKMMVSHDQYGRMDLVDQTRAYLDYFRAMSWFQAPGYDDWNQAVPGRNWRDAKLAASIAQLHRRPRVWLEALHSSGWGLDLQEQVLTLNENYIYGANIYDKHGGDYSTFGSYWSWAPPDAHFRMPYWMHYRPFADYVARMSYLQSRGDHLAGIGIFYPVHSIQANLSANGANDLAALMESYFWSTGQELLKNQIDFHFVHDSIIQKAEVKAGRLSVSGVDFTTMVLPPLTTIDLRTLRKLEEFVWGGGLLVAQVLLPSASVQNGRDDADVRVIVERIFGGAQPKGRLERGHANSGLAVFFPSGVSQLAPLIRSARPVDFETNTATLMYQHRRAQDLDLYMLYNRSSQPASATVTLRAAGAPFRFDSATGRVTPVLAWQRTGDRARMRLEFAPYEAYHVYFDRAASPPALAYSNLDEIAGVALEGGRLQVRGWHRSAMGVTAESQSGSKASRQVAVSRAIELAGDWEFELAPTMDNRWGDYRRPPSEEVIGAEARRFRYRLEGSREDGRKLGWHRPGLDDSSWETCTYSAGPYWWVLGPAPNHGSEIVTISELEPEKNLDLNRTYRLFGQEYRWRPYVFSMQFGLEGDPDYYRTLGPKKQVDPTFIHLEHVEDHGLFYLYTNVWSPRETRGILLTPTGRGAGRHRVWVNGQVVSDPYQDRSGQFGSLIGVDVRKGWNKILIKFNQRAGAPRLFVYLLDQNRILAPQAASPGSAILLERFAQSEFVYDVYGDDQPRVGWYRFVLPPGTTDLHVKVAGKATFYVNGETCSYDPATSQVSLNKPLDRPGLGAIRVEHERGKYAGAAISAPVKIRTQAGGMPPGDWSAQGLENYSGAAVYRKSFELSAEYRDKKLVLDLGQVDATASVRVNGKDAGIRGWSPYKFDITSLVQPGRNRLEVTVANALANHYSAGVPTVYVFEGQTVSGLLGPARILAFSPVEMTLETGRGQ